MNADRIIEISCPSCKGRAGRMLYRVWDIIWEEYGEYDLVECLSCGLITLSPMPSSETLSKAYRSFYDERYFECIHYLQCNWFARVVFLDRLRRIRRVYPVEEGTKFLDVGCGLGGMVEAVLRKGRGIPFATDTSLFPLKYISQKYGNPVLLTDFSCAGIKDDSFDILTFYHSLEHMPGPRIYLEEAFRVLKPGGLLVIEVPNFKGPLRAIFGRYWGINIVPQHINFFTPESLKGLLKGCGFSPPIYEKRPGVPLLLIISIRNVLKTVIKISEKEKNFRYYIFTAISLLIFILLFIPDILISWLFTVFSRGDHYQVMVTKP